MKKRYRVKVGLDYPTSKSAIKRLLAGEEVPSSEQRRVNREPGEVVDDIPACSVPWLVKGGMIEEVK